MVYVNVFGLIPKLDDVDVIVLSYDFLWLRTWPIWREIVRRIQHLMNCATIRIAFPQDDYVCCEYLDDFICSQEIDFVYSPITADLEVLYPCSFARGTKFGEALTGYVDEFAFKQVQIHALPFADRQIDVGQRVRQLSPHLGEKSVLKSQLALIFAKTATGLGFKCDVSTRAEDVLYGDDWYRFLGNTKFTIGAKGGASLADPRGKLANQVRRIRALRPSIGDDDLKSRLKIRNGLSGNFTAISPRIFEASAMGACQILKKDEYLDGFEPWKHYVPIESPSLIDEDVVSVMRDHAQASEIAQSSRDFLIDSGRFTYRRFLSQVAQDVGLSTTRSIAQVSDSSCELDAAIGDDGVALRWVQSYLAGAFADGELSKVEKSLVSGKFLALDESDKEWAFHAESNIESLLRWVEALRSKRLMVESVAIPWRSASSFLQPKPGTTV